MSNFQPDFMGMADAAAQLRKLMQDCGLQDWYVDMGDYKLSIHKGDIDHRSCTLHKVKLDRFADGSYACLICWKNKQKVKELLMIKEVWDNKEFNQEEYIAEINKALGMKKC